VVAAVRAARVVAWTACFAWVFSRAPRERYHHARRTHSVNNAPHYPSLCMCICI